ncbi:5-deoxy-glucuronate isomerase [Pseudoclavibacter sp. RFBG4]|uniref:5-deoxy-glucuronate isomerase n=1 Tax=Pseudoclavibacter sp. RFBG4 TaxID=2080575 RepID=UPI000CE93761|nr:5-deoxy-glucuronate isomerase [Pseudoclavibacter sp. RFBG4]PPG27973.1 5-deoxy-glucuronate isomerase [Pseudoclavibacter sp. RFBG4]
MSSHTSAPPRDAAENTWFRARGALSRDGWESVVDATLPGWEHTGIRVADLSDGVRLELPAGDIERMVIPLRGDASLELDGADAPASVELEGRASVFDGPADVAYLPVGTSAVVTGNGRVAVAEAPTAQIFPFQVLRKSDVPVELRGAGRSSRQVQNFGIPGSLQAAKLIVCEVITPAENWSSYPPHKHDEHHPGHESRLEEIYYFESEPTKNATVPEGADAFGMFATYTSPAGEISINEIVRTGDIALVPFGYHGPAVAAPGYDLYYLNVMAGPDEAREWLISDDPAHGWVREQWTSQEFDSRLPYGTE